MYLARREKKIHKRIKSCRIWLRLSQRVAPEVCSGKYLCVQIGLYKADLNLDSEIRAMQTSPDPHHLSPA